jgi:hypothetical protein
MHNISANTTCPLVRARSLARSTVWSVAAGLALCAFSFEFVGQRNPDPSAFQTHAVFSIDDDAMSLTSVAATIEARRNVPGFSWLRLNFYSFRFTAVDIAGAVNGQVDSMDKKWKARASNPKDYNHSNAVVQLSVDKDLKVWQVDVSVPGHACTIAASERDVKSVLQDYRFDGKRLRLKSKGSFVCDMKSLGIPNQRFGWDLDLDVPVFRKTVD